MEDFLYKDLSYKIIGIIYQAKKNYGLGHKEVLYQRALAELFNKEKIEYEKEKRIEIYSPETGKIICYYQPDFLIEDKIIVELKAKEVVTKSDRDRMYSYLRNSKFELGLFVNYGSSDVEIKRIVYSNTNKEWYKKELQGSA